MSDPKKKVLQKKKRRTSDTTGFSWNAIRGEQGEQSVLKL